MNIWCRFLRVFIFILVLFFFVRRDAAIVENINLNIIHSV